jgi:anti-sigma-K factor RskA
MNLARPDRQERLDRLAAEYALGTASPRVRRRLAAIARRDRTVATALSAWERRLAILAEDVPGIAPPPRVWREIVARLGLDPEGASRTRVAWWQRVDLWRAFAVASFIVAVVLGVVEYQRQGQPVAAPLVVVLAGADAKPGLIATGTHGERYLTLKSIGNTAPAAGKVFELWALPQAGVPRSLGVIPSGGVVRVPLAAPVDESLSNIPSLAVSLEPPGGSPTGQPTGPVLYSGSIERMY